MREALRELDSWGVNTVFALTAYEDTSGKRLSIIRDWRDLMTSVGDIRALLQSLKDTPTLGSFADKVSQWCLPFTHLLDVRNLQ